MRIPLDPPPGLFGDDTTLAAEGRWATGSNVRFRLGKPETIGGWESLTSDLLAGVCRGVLAWTENSEVLDIAFGTHRRLYVWQGGGLYDITPYGPPTRLGSAPMSVVNGQPTVTVTHVAHGFTTGQLIKVSGSTAVGGITPNIATVAVTVVNDDSYTYTFTSNASSTASGGGTNVVVTRLSELPMGAVDGTGSAGYGTGAYGVGPWGITSPQTVYYPRTWSLAPWGEQLLASPRGGGLYLWTNDLAQRAVAVENAPQNITHMLVAPMAGGYQAFALGCNEETSGEFNPLCIRYCSIRNLTEWSTSAAGSTAREQILTGGGRIVAGRMVGDIMLVWTSDALFMGQFVGSITQPWRFTRVAKGAGLIGPNAVIVVGQRAFWIGPDQQFYQYGLGGSPEVLPCPIWTGFAENLAVSQADKIVASSNGKFSEVRFDYPDNSDGGYENNRYISLCISGPDAGAWHRGEMGRTFFLDAGPTAFPIGVAYDPEADQAAVFYHEKGYSADGAAFAWFIESADSYLSPDQRMEVREVWPDFKDQMGPVTVKVKSRESPQGQQTSVSALPMAPGDEKADILTSGRLFNVCISGSSSPTACRSGRLLFDVVPAGLY